MCWSYPLLADRSVVPGHSLHWLSHFCPTEGLMDCPASGEEICLRQWQASATDTMNVADMQDFHVARHRGASDLMLGSLSSPALWWAAFILHNLFKMAAWLQVRSVLLGGASKLYPAQMSLMKLWPWPPVTLFGGRLSHTVDVIFWSQTVFPCHTCLFVCIITTYSHNELFLYRLIYLFLFC